MKICKEKTKSIICYFDYRMFSESIYPAEFCQIKNFWASSSTCPMPILPYILAWSSHPTLFSIPRFSTYEGVTCKLRNFYRSSYRSFPTKFLITNFIIYCTFRGVKPYRYAMSSFRRSLLLYLSHPSLDLLSIVADVDKRTIEARWKVSGWTPITFLTTLIFKLTNVPW